LRFPIIEQFITTPAFHHWHHTKIDHIDHNFAAMLPWIDRLFGTYYLPKTWPEEYGIQSEMKPELSSQLLNPFHDNSH